MDFTRLSRCVVTLLIIFILNYSATPPAEADDPSGKQKIPSELSAPAQLAVEHIGEVAKTSLENLIVVNEHKRVYPVTNRTFWGVTVLNRRTRQFHQMLVNAEVSGVADPADVEAAEQTAYLARYGKLAPALYVRLQKATSDDVIPVAVWLTGAKLADVDAQLTASYFGKQHNIIGGKILETDNPALLKQLRQDRLRLLAQAHLSLAKPLADFLTGQGYQIRISKYVPLLIADLPAGLIQEIAIRQEVDTIYLAGSQSVSFMDSVVLTEQIKEVWETGIDGSGVEIAIFEDGNVQGGDYLNLIAVRPGNPDARAQEHATAVANIAAANQSALYPGVAPDAEIISAGFRGDDLEMDAIEALEWAIDEGADVINASFGFIPASADNYVHTFDRVMDYIIRYNYVTVAVGAGNINAVGNYIGTRGD